MRLISIGAYLLERQRRRLVAAGERTLVFPTRWTYGWTVILHRDTYPARRGLWRITSIDSEGEPTGHQCGTTFAETLKLAARDGADLFEARSP
jgi:hypothetical protein